MERTTLAKQISELQAHLAVSHNGDGSAAVISPCASPKGASSDSPAKKRSTSFAAYFSLSSPKASKTKPTVDTVVVEAAAAAAIHHEHSLESVSRRLLAEDLSHHSPLPSRVGDSIGDHPQQNQRSQGAYYSDDEESLASVDGLLDPGAQSELEPSVMGGADKETGLRLRGSSAVASIVANTSSGPAVCNDTAVATQWQSSSMSGLAAEQGDGPWNVEGLGLLVCLLMCYLLLG